MKHFTIPKAIFGFFLFGFSGITIDFFFTALYHLFFAFVDGTTPDWGLKGHSYI